MREIFVAVTADDDTPVEKTITVGNIRIIADTRYSLAIKTDAPVGGTQLQYKCPSEKVAEMAANCEVLKPTDGACCYVLDRFVALYGTLAQVESVSVADGCTE